MDILSILFSKLGAIGAGIIALLSLWLYGKHQRAKRIEAESRAEVAETVMEVEHDKKNREKIVERMDNNDVLRYWGSNGVRKDGSSGPAAPPGQADHSKSGKG